MREANDFSSWLWPEPVGPGAGPAPLPPPAEAKKQKVLMNFPRVVSKFLANNVKRAEMTLQSIFGYENRHVSEDQILLIEEVEYNCHIFWDCLTFLVFQFRHAVVCQFMRISKF